MKNSNLMNFTYVHNQSLGKNKPGNFLKVEFLLRSIMLFTELIADEIVSIII
jgi:hypothetical protein